MKELLISLALTGAVFGVAFHSLTEYRNTNQQEKINAQAEEIKTLNKRLKNKDDLIGKLQEDRAVLALHLKTKQRTIVTEESLDRIIKETPVTYINSMLDKMDNQLTPQNVQQPVQRPARADFKMSGEGNQQQSTNSSTVRHRNDHGFALADESKSSSENTMYQCEKNGIVHYYSSSVCPSGYITRTYRK